MVTLKQTANSDTAQPALTQAKFQILNNMDDELFNIIFCFSLYLVYCLYI